MELANRTWTLSRPLFVLILPEDEELLKTQCRIILSLGSCRFNSQHEFQCDVHKTRLCPNWNSLFEHDEMPLQRLNIARGETPLGHNSKLTPKRSLVWVSAASSDSQSTSLTPLCKEVTEEQSTLLTLRCWVCSRGIDLYFEVSRTTVMWECHHSVIITPDLKPCQMWRTKSACNKTKGKHLRKHLYVTHSDIPFHWLFYSLQYGMCFQHRTCGDFGEEQAALCRVHV